MPANVRNNINQVMFGESAERIAEVPLINKFNSMTGRRPYLSPITPPMSPPRSIPANTDAVRKPTYIAIHDYGNKIVKQQCNAPSYLIPMEKLVHRILSKCSQLLKFLLHLLRFRVQES